MRYKLLAVSIGVAVIFAVALVPTTSAHRPGDRYDYYWKSNRAESKLYNRFDDVDKVTCRGYGKRLRGNYFRHLRCRVVTFDGEVITAYVHVTGSNTYRVTF